MKKTKKKRDKCKLCGKFTDATSVVCVRCFRKAFPIRKEKYRYPDHIQNSQYDNYVLVACRKKRNKK